MRNTPPSSQIVGSTAIGGMPFSLKNAGATYQRLVNMMFKDLIRKTMDVYVDDMLVKSRMAGDHVEHLRQMFNVLRKYQMKLSP